jgi:hypothetical protein
MEPYLTIIITLFLGLIGLSYGLFKKLIQTEAALHKSETNIELAVIKGDIESIKKDVSNIWNHLKKGTKSNER